MWHLQTFFPSFKTFFHFLGPSSLKGKTPRCFALRTMRASHCCLRPGSVRTTAMLSKQMKMCPTRAPPRTKSKTAGSLPSWKIENHPQIVLVRPFLVENQGEGCRLPDGGRNRRSHRDTRQKLVGIPGCHRIITCHLTVHGDPVHIT